MEEPADTSEITKGGNLLNGLLREIFKCLGVGVDLYYFGEGKEFKSWLETRYPAIWRAVLRDVGERHDKQLEGALPLLYMAEYIVEWLVELEQTRDKPLNKLFRAIASTLPTKAVMSGLLARSIFFIQIWQPWRIAINDKKVGSSLADHHTFCEQLVLGLDALIDDPERAMSQEFEVFTSSAVQKQSRSYKENNADEVQHAFNKCDDPELRTGAAKFLRALAQGAKKGVIRMCADFLTAGQFHPGTATPEIMTQLAKFPTTSDKIESVFALLDFFMLNYRNLSFLSLSGMTLCRANKTFTRFLGRPETRPEIEHALVSYVASKVPEDRRAATRKINEISVGQRREQAAKTKEVKRKRKQRAADAASRRENCAFLESQQALNSELAKVAGMSDAKQREVYAGQWQWFRDYSARAKEAGKAFKVPPFKPSGKHRSLEEYATLWPGLVKQVHDLNLRRLQADPSAATFTVAPGLTPTRQRQRLADALTVEHAVMMEEIGQERVQAALEKEASKVAKAHATKAKRAAKKKPKKNTSKKPKKRRPPEGLSARPRKQLKTVSNSVVNARPCSTRVRARPAHLNIYAGVED
jgi:hypothetical protein